jgi:OmpA-OmpF porin, OOP family
MDSMMGLLSSGDNLSTLSNSIGGDEKSTKSAMGMALPTLLGSLSKTASTSGGADTLTKALGQTSGSNPLDNVSGYLSKPDVSGGSNMVSSLLGSQMTPIQSAISQKTGLPSAAVGKLLAIVTPMVMGKISKMLSGKKVDANSLSTLLGDQAKQAMQSSPEATDITKQLEAAQKDSGGITAKLKNVFKK